MGNISKKESERTFPLFESGQTQSYVIVVVNRDEVRNPLFLFPHISLSSLPLGTYKGRRLLPIPVRKYLYTPLHWLSRRGPIRRVCVCMCVCKQDHLQSVTKL